MPINKTLITFFLFFVTFLSSVLCSAQGKTKSRNSLAAPRTVIPYNHPTLNAPQGMVYIRGGTTRIKYDQSSTDSNSLRKVSLTSFFIDRTEVTNEQYRQFINWVIDSIAVVQYLKDDKYFIETKNNDKVTVKGNNSNSGKSEKPKSVSTTNPGVSPIDTANLANTGNVSDTTAINKPENEAITNKRIDWSKVDHKKIFNSKDEEIKSKILPMLDENGNIKKEMYNYTYTYLKPNPNPNKKTKSNQYKTATLNIYPNENVWADDLTNSQTEMYVENYFKAPPFNDYPVVGVNWLQANAFCYWRGTVSSGYFNMPNYMKYYNLKYALPSEAQWVYAAQGYYDMISAIDSSSMDSVISTFVTADTTLTPHDSSFVAQMLQPKTKVAKVIDSSKLAAREERNAQRKAAKRGNMYLADYMKFKFVKYGGKYSNNYNPLDLGGPYSDSTPIHKDINGMLENFKQDEGDYWEDGSALTTPVLAFAPNEFGLYNMEGNVSEWVMDAYSPSVFAFVSDLNPVLLYDADSTDAEAMRRKVVRGGSFMSNAKSLTPYYRDLELQNVSHCFVGFRCVLQAPEIIYKNMATRDKTLKGHNTKGKLSNLRLPEIH